MYSKQNSIFVYVVKLTMYIIHIVMLGLQYSPNECQVIWTDSAIFKTPQILGGE